LPFKFCTNCPERRTTPPTPAEKATVPDLKEIAKAVSEYTAARLDHEEAVRRKTLTFWDHRDDGNLRDAYLAALKMERHLAGILADLRRRLVALGVDPDKLKNPEERIPTPTPRTLTPLEEEIEAAPDGRGFSL
jgi:hypothetical protein